jgi:hypothetical protein
MRIRRCRLALDPDPPTRYATNIRPPGPMRTRTPAATIRGAGNQDDEWDIPSQARAP